MQEDHAFEKDEPSIDVEVETEHALEDAGEPRSPRCTLSWEGNRAVVVCESPVDMARARELLTARPVRVKLRSDVEGVEDDQAGTALDH